MDDVAARQRQRQAEIEAKKAKLEEMKRQRALKDKEFQKSRDSLSDRTLIAHPSPLRERVLDDDVIQAHIERLEAAGPTFKSSRPGSRPASVVSAQRLSLCSGDPAPSLTPPPPPSNYRSTATQTSYTDSSTSTSHNPQDPQAHQPNLKPPPRPNVESIYYERSTQTDIAWEKNDVWLGAGEGNSQQQDLNVLKEEWLKEKEADLAAKYMQPAVAGANEYNVEDAAQVTQKVPIRTLKGEELDSVVLSADFRDFLDKSARIADRALDEKYDILIDYSKEATDFDQDDDGDLGPGRRKKERRLKQVLQFWDEKWSRNRCISDVNFSLKYPELMIASYTRNPSALHEPHGIVQLWNCHMPSRPEYIFHANSDVLTTTFSPFHPKLIIGGCYSGQVLLWDTRVNSPHPSQKTPLTGLGHSHPIYSLKVVGTPQSNNIISCSTDGVVCSWTVDMLVKPEKLELLAPPPAKFEDVAPQCIAFTTTNATYFLAGSEEGTIYGCHRYERAGAKAGIDSRVLYAGHEAPVMSLDFHPSTGSVDLGDLVLSASMDWSVKLWRVKPTATLGSAVTGVTSVQKCVIDIPREDIVYDVKWSPVRPGVFALVDGAGALEIWDINHDIEVPVARELPTKGMGTALRSLNKCAWEGNEGKRIAVGGLDGVVTVFEVGSELGGFEGARPEEWTQVKKVITKAESTAGAKAALNGRHDGR